MKNKISLIIGVVVSVGLAVFLTASKVKAGTGPRPYMPPNQTCINVGENTVHYTSLWPGTIYYKGHMYQQGNTWDGPDTDIAKPDGSGGYELTADIPTYPSGYSCIPSAPANPAVCSVVFAYTTNCYGTPLGWTTVKSPPVCCIRFKWKFSTTCCSTNVSSTYTYTYGTLCCAP